MQQTAPSLAINVTWIGLIVLIAIVSGIVAAIRQGYGKAVIATLGLMFLAGLSLTGFKSSQESGLRAEKLDEMKQLGLQLHNQASVQVSMPEKTTVTGKAMGTATTPTKIQFITGNSPPVEIPELPSWRKTPVHEGSLESGQSKYVLVSQQFATLEEAENELYQSLTTDVRSGFAFHHPSTQGWVPTHEDIRGCGLITEKVIETIPLQVGEFTTPVQRVSWLVEFKPASTRALLARWEPTEAERRSKLILSFLAGFSGVLGVSAIALRRSRDHAAPASATA